MIEKYLLFLFFLTFHVRELQFILISKELEAIRKVDKGNKILVV